MLKHTHLSEVNDFFSMKIYAYNIEEETLLYGTNDSWLPEYEPVTCCLSTSVPFTKPEYVQLKLHMLDQFNLNTGETPKNASYVFPRSPKSTSLSMLKLFSINKDTVLHHPRNSPERIM